MSLLERNIKGLSPLKTSAWRKISMGTWSIKGDSSVYGAIEYNVDPALEYIKKKSEQTGERITFTHFVGKATALAIKEVPQANTLIRWGKLYARPTIDLFFHAALDTTGEDLSGSIIREVDKKSLSEIANELGGKVDRMRKHGDEEFNQIKGVIGFIPTFFLRIMLNMVGFILYSLNLWTPLLNVKKDPFGAVMVTNVGSLGIDQAFTPISYYSRVNMILAVGKIQERPAFEGDEVVRQKRVTLSVTFDHRILDGVHAARLNRKLAEIFANPEMVEG